MAAKLSSKIEEDDDSEYETDEEFDKLEEYARRMKERGDKILKKQEDERNRVQRREDKIDGLKIAMNNMEAKI